MAQSISALDPRACSNLAARKSKAFGGRARACNSERCAIHTRPARYCTISSMKAYDRRELVLGLSAASAASVLTGGSPPKALALRFGDSLSEKLLERNLPKPVFNIPPREATYPDWLEGTWDVKAEFAGYAFPSKFISKRRLVADPTVPGFQKLSLLFIPDVGTNADYELRFIRDNNKKVIEDRAYNIKSVVDGYYKNPGTVRSVEYSKLEPNRCSVRLAPGASPNAERFELFSNARESETRQTDGTFFQSESIRQVTLGFTPEYGVGREVITDYQHVWTFTPLGDGKVQGTLSTAGYLQPNDLLKYTSEKSVPIAGNILDAATQPVIFFSHILTMDRK